MKLFTQARDAVIELPTELRVVDTEKATMIVGCKLERPVLAFYTSEERAKEVVREIFEYYRNGKNSYIMPLE